MNKYDKAGRSPLEFREGRSVAGLTAALALAVMAYVGMRAALPELPLHVLQALTALPS